MTRNQPTHTNREIADNKLWFTGGTVSDDHVYTAPAGAQAVVGGLDVSQLDGSQTTVKLGHFVIAPKGCMIQMRAGPTEMTYTFDGEYTEFRDSGTGNAMYMSRVDMAGYENGWLRLPAQAKTMIMGKMDQNISREMGSVDRLIRDRYDFHISQMPKSMSLRFSWPFLSVGAKGLDGKTLKEKKADCPAWSGTSKCTQTVVSIEGNAVPVTFNGAGQPLIVKFFDGNTFEFEYGNFSIRRPSGW
jgi:hypothetical protein